MQRILLIGLAGSLGATARYLLGGWLQRLDGSTFPWGTVGVNILGCLLFGLIWTLTEDRMLISAETRLIVLTGFMGAFTTFSTFIFETGQMLRAEDWVLAVFNAGGQFVVGLLALFLGMALGRIV